MRARAYPIRPARDPDVSVIAARETQFFGSDALPEELLRAWFHRNPAAFSVVFDPMGAMVAHIVLLPVRLERFEPFLAGHIIERDLGPDAIWPQGERNQVAAVYVESVIAGLAPDRPVAAFAVASLLSNARGLVTRIAGPRSRPRVYAMSVSPEAERLLRRLGFAIVSPRDGRADHHDLWAADYAVLHRGLAHLGDS